MQNIVDSLESMPYPGRVILAGMNEEGERVFVYCLSGRSSSSQARKLKLGAKTGVVSTEVTDSDQLNKGSRALLIYPAEITFGEVAILSNGAQTNQLHSASRLYYASTSRDPHSTKANFIMRRVFAQPNLEYDPQEERIIDLSDVEPDSSQTPRISLVSFSSGGCMHIVRKSGGPKSEHSFFPFDFELGRANLLATYSGKNIDPLPAFAGDPIVGRFEGMRTPADTARAFYKALSPDVRVSVMAMHVHPMTNVRQYHIINKVDGW